MRWPKPARGVNGMRTLLIVLAAAFLVNAAPAQRTIAFPTSDGGVVFADLYGHGEKGLVLAHGGELNKESWGPQARQFEAAGYFVLAFDFRGYGSSHGPGQADLYTAPLHEDVLAAVRY